MAVAMRSDVELLKAYAGARDEAAFAELVARHGPMVYRACLRILGNGHDAEEASQATFVVLLRKAGRLSGGGDLAAWLHSVARHVALRSRRGRLRRSRSEEDAAMLRSAESVVPEPGAGGPALGEDLDRELAALSAGQRQAVVLRYLEGRSEKEAAEVAGVPVGTLSRRASDGLERLRARLCQRGQVLGAAALVGLLGAEATAAVPAALLPSILAVTKLAAAGAAAGTAGIVGAVGAQHAVPLQLAEGAMKAMFWIKVKLAAAVLVGAAAVGGGGAAVIIAAAEPAVPNAAGRKPIAESGVSEKGIECRVTELIAGGKVRLSAGSAQGVREKFEFDVSRGGQPVGAVKVVAVEDKQSTAEIASVTGEIKVGDTARTRFGTVLAGPGVKPVAPAEAGKIAWGEAVDGLQAGLVPLGGAAGESWPLPTVCPACKRRNDALGPRFGGAKDCPQCHTFRMGTDSQMCQKCAELRRVCQLCGAAKPWGTTFVEGEPISLELHFKNVGENALALFDVEHGSSWSIAFAPDGLAPGWSAFWGVKDQRAIDSFVTLDLAKGAQKTASLRLASGWMFRVANPGHGGIETKPLSALPAGKYTVIASYEHAAAHPQPKPCPYWHGKVATGAVEIEIRAKGAAAAKGGEAVNGLSLRLEAAKAEYRQGEPLELRVFLDNVGDKPLVVLKRTTHVEMGIEAQDAGKQFIVSQLPPAPPPRLKAEDLAPLAAGASLELKNWEMLIRINWEIKTGHGRTGRFTIRASYRAQAEGDFWNVRKLDPNAWVGALQSNAVEVEISPMGAAGADDLAALVAKLASKDGAERAAATKRLFELDRAVTVPALEKAGARELATISPPRINVVYSLIQGLKAGSYQSSSLGAMGQKHGFTLTNPDRFSATTAPSAYVQLQAGRALADVMKALLSDEPKVVTVNLNYVER
jgi:RNA polymerase sigma factor (sigma-70 family)